MSGTDWTQARSRLRMEFGLGLAMRGPRAFAMVTPLDTQTPAQILAELRATHPAEAMVLGEYLVPDENGKVPSEQIDGLINVLGLNA